MSDAIQLPLLYVTHRVLSHLGMPLVRTNLPGGNAVPLFTTRELLDDFLSKSSIDVSDLVFKDVGLDDFEGTLQEFSMAGIQYATIDPPNGGAIHIGRILAHYRGNSSST